MTKELLAKIWFTLIFLQVSIVIPLRLVVDWNNEYGQFDNAPARSLNVLFYFTNLSNILVAIVSFLLVIKLKRTEFRFQVLTLTSLVCITVAGIVYWLMLASEDKVTGIDVYTNFAVHTSVPIMFVLGWLFFMVHGYTTLKTIRYSLIFPIGWAIFAMVRGEIIDWYPYPFMDVRDIGYVTALINMSFVTLFFIALYVGAHFLDSKLPYWVENKN